MYALPLSILLIPYAIVLFFVAFFSFINIYHLVYYGATTKSSFAVTFLYLAGIVAILFATSITLAGTEWSEPLPIEIPSITAPTFDTTLDSFDSFPNP